MSGKTASALSPKNAKRRSSPSRCRSRVLEPVRETFSLSRTLEFFSEAELTKQIGYKRSLWLLAIAKELVDNAMDHCEEIDRLPTINLSLARDAISIQDNGDGIPPETVEAMLDFDRRVSSREAYRCPTRGAQGNAGKCILGVPFVLNGDRGRTTIIAQAWRHEITVSLDQLAQKPQIDHQRQPEKEQNGTFLKVHLNELASILDGEQIAQFVLFGAHYAAMNPHLTLTLELPDGTRHQWYRTRDTIDKWTSAIPEPPAWHDAASMKRLVGACIAKDRANGTDRSLRQFLRPFAGLKRSESLKAVCDETGMMRANLSSLVNGKGLDDHKIVSLLDSMQRHGTAPKPHKLGAIGRNHVEHVFRQIGVSGAPRYKKAVGHNDGLPFVVEAAFADLNESYADRTLISGCNFTPSIDRPVLRMLDGLLERQMVDDSAPVVVLLHIATVAPTYLDRGKSLIDVDGELEKAIDKCVTSVTADYCRRRKAAERDALGEQRRLERLGRSRPDRTLKDAIREVIDESIHNASGGRVCEFSDRDFYYAARKLIQQFTDQPLSQSWFDKVVDEWEIENGLIPGRLRDARGFLLEPHVRNRIPLGTKEVDEYEIPAHLYHTILYFEKKGLLGKLEWGQIGERFDAAIICAEGYAVRAAKALLQAAQHGHRVTVLCFHDCDPHGYNIARTLSESTGAHSYNIEVIDAGLHLEEALDMDLAVETFTRKKALPSELKLSNIEREYFEGERKRVIGKNGSPTFHWVNCRRVELNALSADPHAFIEWVEAKLAQHGVAKKLLPPKKVIAARAKHQRDAILRSHIKQCVLAEFDVDAKVESLAKQFNRRVKTGDMPAAVKKWAETVKPEHWTNCVDMMVSRAVHDVDEDIVQAVQKMLRP